MREARCTAEQPPACTASCPVHVDARGMIERVRAGDFTAALAIFARSVPFPRIISAICDRPCEAACRRRDAGDAVAIRALERASVDLGRWPKIKRPAPKAKRVAVVGSGLSGLVAASDLAAKGFETVLLEAGPRPGGRLLGLVETSLTARALDADLERLGALGVEVRTSISISSCVALAEEFDAVYAGTGPSGAAPAIDPVSLATDHPRVFAGGGLRQGASYSPILSVLDGRRAANSIDRLFQKASLTAGRDGEGPCASRLFVRTDGVAAAPRVEPGGEAGGYTSAEAVAEAGRCLDCHCRECTLACPYLAHHGSVPKRYIREIYNNDCIVMGSHKANKLANGCALCGLCEAVCPEKLGMAETCREARESMVDKGKMPPSAHEFALRDMAFCQGDDFALCANAPGTSQSEVVFFPGCQLAASAPGNVERVYAVLRERLGAVGIHLGCCGAPAEWAGRRDLAQQSLTKAADAWRALGARRVITACPSCTRVFGQVAGIEVESLWTVLARSGEGFAQPVAPATLAIHDPCSARHDRGAQDAVRSLLEGQLVSVVEPSYTRERTTCCSYGGLMSFAHRAVADKLVAQRVAESDHDYVTYCAMCRDNFAARGKRSVHVLDVLFGSAGAGGRPPGYSQRRAARRALKARLASALGQPPPPSEGTAMELTIPDTVAAQLEERMILREDVERTIAYAEATGDKILDRSTGHVVASHRPALVTYWVEYSPAGAGFTVHGVWSHRIVICEEPST